MTVPPYWYVKHRQHEHVPASPGSATLVADGSEINRVRPENLEFVMQLGALGPGSITYEVSFNATDPNTGDPVISPDFIGPQRTDWELWRSDFSDPLMAGRHTQVTGLDSDDPVDHIQVAGADWLDYLNHRVWPYDADPQLSAPDGFSYVDWPVGFRFKVTAGEVGRIVKDLLETIRDVSPNWPASPDTLGPHPSYSMPFTVDADDTGFTINYEISNFDGSSIYSLVQALSQMGNTRGGFDFYFTWDKVFRLVAPELGHPLSPIYTLEVDATTHLANMRSVGFTNDGPEATHVLGVGAGTSTQQGGINKHFRASSAAFNRLDKVADFGDVKNLDQLESLTSLDLAFGANPVHEIPIEVCPADIPNFWDVTRPGEYVAVVYDLGFHQISSTQRIVSMTCRVDLEGNETVQLAFNQFYDASDHSGLDDF